MGVMREMDGQLDRQAQCYTDIQADILIDR